MIDVSFIEETKYGFCISCDSRHPSIFRLSIGGYPEIQILLCKECLQSLNKKTGDLL